MQTIAKLTDNFASKAMVSFRMRPYGFGSYYDTYNAVLEYQLTPETLSRISCPMLVTDPANEDYWPGQARILYDGLKSPKTLVHFSPESGGDLHCEPKSSGLRDSRIYDWLDETLKGKCVALRAITTRLIPNWLK